MVQAKKEAFLYILMIRSLGSEPLKKTAYYLWSHPDSQEEYERTKEQYTKMGFRVVTFKEGQDKESIREGIKLVIKNHMAETNPF